MSAPRKRVNTGFTREEWREYKLKHGLVTHWDVVVHGMTRPIVNPRAESRILADAAQLLSQQWTAQRKRWGF